jgi:hypothetical protein
VGPGIGRSAYRDGAAISINQLAVRSLHYHVGGIRRIFLSVWATGLPDYPTLRL